jgi:hypothetical protein
MTPKECRVNKFLKTIILLITVIDNDVRFRYSDRAETSTGFYDRCNVRYGYRKIGYFMFHNF